MLKTEKINNNKTEKINNNKIGGKNITCWL